MLGVIILLSAIKQLTLEIHYGNIATILFYVFFHCHTFKKMEFIVSKHGAGFYIIIIIIIIIIIWHLQTVYKCRERKVGFRL